MRGYYFITDSNMTKDSILEDTVAAVDSGARVVQYRRKDADTDLMYKEAFRLRGICSETTFIVNDRIDIAMAVDADGVHLGDKDMPYEVARRILGKEKIFGITVHSIEDAILAEGMGADYLGVGPIYPTTTKDDPQSPVGVEIISEIRKKCTIPVIAIGGITFDNVKPVIAAGADMVCAIGAVYRSGDIGAEIGKFQSLFDL